MRPRASISLHRFSPAAFLLLISFGVLTGCHREEASSASSIPPLDPVVSAYLSEAMQALGQQQYERALALTEKAEQHRPGLPETHLVRGRIHFMVRQFEEAHAAWKQAVALDPDRAEGWELLGSAAYQQRQFREALAHYRKAASLRPTVYAWQGMGTAYVELHRPDSAMRAYREAIRLDSLYAPAYAGLAALHEKAGEDEAALSYARRARQLEPDHLPYRYVLGHLLLRTGQPKEAARVLLSIVEKQPYDHSALYSLGQAYQQMGLDEQADSYLQRAAEARAAQASMKRLQRLAQEEPGHPQHYVALAEALQKAGSLDQALLAYRQAARLRPDDLTLQQSIADLYLQRGDAAQARLLYERILQRDSARAEVWLKLGDAYEYAGEMDRAHRARQAAARLDPTPRD